jgi:predicted outer membrane repeat protein
VFTLSSLRLAWITLAALAGAFVLALLWAPAVPVRSAPTRPAGTVGNGTPGSCTSKALADALAAGSGTISFACGPAPVTILITQSGGLIIPGGVQVTLEGDHQIELSGGLAWRVFTVNGGASLTLRNLSVVKGYSPGDDGGAIYNGGELTVEGCLFADNQTAAPYAGGAIVSYGPLSIDNSEFRHNQAGNGGAVYPRFAGAVTVITGTTFDGNAAITGTDGWGGALLWDGAPVTLVGNTFRDNVARHDGGAVYVEGASGLTVSATAFISNAAQAITSGGGAIYSQGTLSVTASTFAANHASDVGGAILTAGGTTGLRRSAFVGNWAVVGGAYSQLTGALFASDSWFSGNGYDPSNGPFTNQGGAIDNEGGTVVLNNLTLNGNWASFGSGYFQDSLRVTASALQNVTVSGNAANYGGGLYQLGGSTTLTNVTVYQNKAAVETGGIESISRTLTVRNTIVADNAGGNCNVPLVSPAFDLSSDASCGFGFGRDNVNVQLLGLYNSGGFAPTHLPKAGSPAVDNASLLYCPPPTSAACPGRRARRAMWGGRAHPRRGRARALPAPGETVKLDALYYLSTTYAF